MLKLLSTVPNWVIRSVQQRGVRKTVAIATSFAADYTFDLKYGTETHIQTFPDYSDPNTAGFAHYQATKAGPFLTMLQSLDFPPQSVFVDVGCGKGKALMVAGLLSKGGQPFFKRIVGLEYDKGLCRHAVRNVEIFRQKQQLPPVEIVEGDAAKHAFAGDENVIFLYNSFDDSVLKRFLVALERSLAEHPRKLWLIYGSPRFPEIVDNSGLFEERKQYDFSGNDFYVYTVGPQGAATPLRYASA